MKRAFDVLVAGAGLVVSAPLWLAIAAAITLGDGGPVFFPQRRVGIGGRVFIAHKFRSMRVGAEREPTRQAAAHDPRVTPVGRILRATAMDELPQLWNIFRGDMSFVGPRPLAEGEIGVEGGSFVRLIDVPGYAERHTVRPGLTGLAQVYAPRDLRTSGKFRLDRLYVRRQSFCFDLRLILISFWITCRGRWEHRGPKV